MSSLEDEETFMPSHDAGDDILGLDTNISITKRKPVARLDATRILDEEKGVSYITRNHRRIYKAMRSNDKRLHQKLKSQRFLDAKEVRNLKVENELTNLSSVLGFYQTWCHQLFPKATFKDCISLLRARGATSSEITFYRRELINAEILKTQRASGPYVDEEEEEDQVEPDAQAQAQAQVEAHSAVPEDNGESNVIIDDNESSARTRRSNQPQEVNIQDDDWMMEAAGITPTGTVDTNAKEISTESKTASDIDDNDFGDELQLFKSTEEFPDEGDYL